MEKTKLSKDDPKRIELFGEPEEGPEKANREKNGRKKKDTGKKSKTGIIILLCILGVLLLALIGVSVFAWHVCHKPTSFFENVTRVSAATEKPAATPVIDIEQYLPTSEPGTTPIPIPSLAPTATATAETQDPLSSPSPEKQTDTQKMSGIVNVALFGIDAYESGRSTSGTMPHTDANVILAINFDTKEVSLISIARDCFTTAPGYRGFYKFNGVFNVGGGMKDPKAGFELSCRAAEQWLGGVSIPYYYGVDFQALIDLVDMIGGIDFKVDIKLYTLDGHTINPGNRHLNGQGVMAYMRMRKSAGGLDSKRTERQRKMLVAIFKKLKQEGKLSQIPDILKTLGDNVYTNTGTAQTAALVNFASEIDPDSIKAYSIQGEIHGRYDWSFCFIDQQRRIDIIKEVYGFDAEPMRINSIAYETFLNECGYLAIQCYANAEQLFDAIHKKSPDTDQWTEAQKTAYAVCWQDYQNLKAMFDVVNQWTQAHYDQTVELTREEKEERSRYYQTLEKLIDQVRNNGTALNKAFGKPYHPSWYRDPHYWWEKDSIVNEVYVDFR